MQSFSTAWSRTSTTRILRLYRKCDPGTSRRQTTSLNPRSTASSSERSTIIDSWLQLPLGMCRCRSGRARNCEEAARSHTIQKKQVPRKETTRRGKGRECNLHLGLTRTATAPRAKLTRKEKKRTPPSSTNKASILIQKAFQIRGQLIWAPLGPKIVAWWTYPAKRIAASSWPNKARRCISSVISNKQLRIQPPINTPSNKS